MRGLLASAAAGGRIPNWGLVMMFVSSVIGAWLLWLEIMSRHQAGTLG